MSLSSLSRLTWPFKVSTLLFCNQILDALPLTTRLVIVPRFARYSAADVLWRGGVFICQKQEPYG